jgi:phospholipase/carboxylesterase
MKELNLAGMTVRLVGGVDREGGGDGPLVVLMHGFGAPGDDLVSLWRVLDAPSGTRGAFPAAPHVLGRPAGAPASAFRDSRAWWMVDMERRLSAAERGALEALTLEVPPGMEEARAAVTALINELDSQLRPTKIVLGGFSQGAMLACDVALRTDRVLAGVVLLSGTLLAAKEWAAIASRRRGLAVFQSHGALDQLLPFAYAEKLRDLLIAGGVDVTWLPFRGGHEIPDGVVIALGRWLRTALA